MNLIEATQAIYTLYDQGNSISEISTKVGFSRFIVESMLEARLGDASQKGSDSDK